uniref:Uncharacterized protein n=1 Tax=Panagrolaimus sp. JU765 TaxID=591449 RepID=A0AC34Q2T4_9BILA
MSIVADNLKNVEESKDDLIKASETWKLEKERLTKVMDNLKSENETLKLSEFTSTEQLETMKRRFEDDLTKLHEEQELLMLQLTEKDQQISKLESDMNIVANNLKNVEESNDDLIKATETWKLEAEHLAQKMIDLQAENEALKSSEFTATEQLETMKKRFEVDLTKLHEEQNLLALQLTEKDEQIVKLENDMSIVADNLKNVEECRDDLIKATETWKLESQRLTKMMDDLKSENEALKASEFTATEQLETMKKRFEVDLTKLHEEQGLLVLQLTEKDEQIVKLESDMSIVADNLKNVEECRDDLIKATETWKLESQRLTKMMDDLKSENEALKSAALNVTIPSLALENLDDSDVDSGYGNSARTPRSIQQVMNDDVVVPQIPERKTNYLAWFAGFILFIFGGLFALVYKVIGREMIHIPGIGSIQKKVHYDNLPPQ